MKEMNVVICNYNYEEYLAQAIDSALAQDYMNTHVIVIDDGSTDGSRAIMQAYATRITTIFKDNGGTGLRLQSGASAAQDGLCSVSRFGRRTLSRCSDRSDAELRERKRGKGAVPAGCDRLHQQMYGSLCTSLVSRRRLFETSARRMVVPVTACVRQRV